MLPLHAAFPPSDTVLPLPLLARSWRLSVSVRHEELLAGIRARFGFQQAETKRERSKAAARWAAVVGREREIMRLGGGGGRCCVGMLSAYVKRVALEMGKCWEDPGGAICSPPGLLGKERISDVGMQRSRAALSEHVALLPRVMGAHPWWCPWPWAAWLVEAASPRLELGDL